MKIAKILYRRWIQHNDDELIRGWFKLVNDKMLRLYEFILSYYVQC